MTTYYVVESATRGRYVCRTSTDGYRFSKANPDKAFKYTTQAAAQVISSSVPRTYILKYSNGRFIRIT